MKYIYFIPILKLYRNAVRKMERTPEKDEFNGSNFQSVGNIKIGCISPDASELIDTIMYEWQSHYTAMKSADNNMNDPTYYGFAYWLVRWSGLVQPMPKKETEIKDGN